MGSLLSAWAFTCLKRRAVDADRVNDDPISELELPSRLILVLPWGAILDSRKMQGDSGEQIATAAEGVRKNGEIFFAFYSFNGDVNLPGI